jgi:hypothetical protein
MLGLGTSKTMGAFVIENNRAKVVFKLANFNVFLSPLVCARKTFVRFFPEPIPDNWR